MSAGDAMADPTPRTRLLSLPAVTGSLLGLLVFGSALLAVVPTIRNGVPITPPRGDSVLWWVIQAGTLAWVAFVALAGWRRHRRHAIVLALLCLLALNHLALRPGGWYAQAEPTPAFEYKPHDDYHGYYDGAYYWKAAVDLHEGRDPFRANWYPPPFLLLFAPLTSLTPDKAFAVWWLAVFVSFLLCVLWSYELLLGWGLPEPTAGALAALVWLHNRPAIQTVAELQVNLAMLALLLAGYLALTRRGLVSPVSVAAATFIKVTPAVPAFFLLLAGRFRWAVLYAAAVAAVVAATMAGDGGGLWARFLETVVSKRWPSDSLEGTLVRFAGEGFAVPLAYVLKAAILAWAVWLLRSHLAGRSLAGERPAGWNGIVAFALGSVVMVLVSPAIWPYHRVWFVPGMLFGWAFCVPALVPALLFATALLFWLPSLPLVGALSIFAPGLLLLWCLGPRNLVAAAGEGAAARVFHRLARGSQG